MKLLQATDYGFWLLTQGSAVHLINNRLPQGYAQDFGLQGLRGMVIGALEQQPLWIVEETEDDKREYFSLRDQLYLPERTFYLLNRGVEWNISGKVSSNLTLTGGLMLLDAKYKRTQNGANDGHRVHGTPKLNATLALDWDTPVKGLSINGRVVHFGKSYADTGNKVNVSSWTRFDLGATYDTELAKIPTTFSFNAYNLFDRKYWSTATTVWADGMVMLNPGRTYILSATMHF